MNDISGYEGLYQINNLGHICSKKRKGTKGGRKSTHLGKGGYYMITLYKNCKGKRYYIHRLLANIFISNPKHLNEINHKDGDKANNTITNLEWCTHKENMRHAIVTGLLNPRHPTKLNETKVMEIRKKAKAEKYTQKEIGNMFGISSSHVCMIVNNKRW